MEAGRDFEELVLSDSCVGWVEVGLWLWRNGSSLKKGNAYGGIHPARISMDFKYTT